MFKMVTTAGLAALVAYEPTVTRRRVFVQPRLKVGLRLNSDRHALE